VYHAIPSPKKQKERKRKLIVRSVLLFLGVFLVCFSIVWVFAHPSFQIKKIRIEGNKILSADAVIAVAQRDISGNYFFFFPRTNVLFYPKDAIRSEIVSAFPRANSVAVSLEGDVLIISLSERDPAAIWCGVEKDATTTENGCYYLDKTGYVFDTSPNFSGDAYFKFYGKGLLANGRSAVGQNFISADLLEKLSDLRHTLQRYNKKTDDLFLGDESRAELTAESGCKIVFSTDQDFSALKANMEAVFKSPGWGKEISGTDKCADLEYIDFRFGNKIYYKQKGFVPAPAVDVPVAPAAPAVESTTTPAVPVVPAT
jgi:hypothetical protein